MQRSVVTVQGPRPNQPHGMVDAHTHLWIDPPVGVQAGDAPVLTDEGSIGRELAAFRASGGAAALDCQPPGTGRDVTRLVSLSRASGVDIVAATGFHLQRYYSPGAWIWSAPVEDLTHFFVSELTHGTLASDGTPTAVRAGFIKTAHPGSLNDADSVRLFSAACAAVKQTGAAILVHTEQGRGVEALADFFVRNGVAAGRVVLCHMDKRPDFSLHRELARAGFLLEYDTFLRPKYEPSTRVWPLLERVLVEGYAASVACGLDLADASLWRFRGGGPGMLGFSEVVRPGLERLGASPTQVEALLGRNIYACIARSPHGVEAQVNPRDEHKVQSKEG
ncbi:MAG: hypothetical protein ACOY94_01140 [Bacillota bacterium]